MNRMKGTLIAGAFFVALSFALVLLYSTFEYLTTKKKDK